MARLLPPRLDIDGLDYAPENELGVIYLFSLLSKQLGFRGVTRIQSPFPDCIARMRTGKGDKEVRIEFEYKSSNYRQHRHPIHGCDYIVCWLHDWLECPRQLKVIELRREVGLGFDVWIQPVRPAYWDMDDSKRSVFEWTVAGQAKIGDLVLRYHTKPRGQIGLVGRIIGEPFSDSTWKSVARVRVVMRLKKPLPLEMLASDYVLSGASFLRPGALQGRPNVTEYWPCISRLIANLNKSQARLLQRYLPQ